MFHKNSVIELKLPRRGDYECVSVCVCVCVCEGGGGGHVQLHTTSCLLV